jgi:hypothetical protein
MVAESAGHRFAVSNEVSMDAHEKRITIGYGLGRPIVIRC